MTATGKFIPPPDGKITGKITDMGTISGLPFNDRSEKSVMFKGRALFSVAGHVGGTVNMDVYEMDFKTRVAKKSGITDLASGSSDRIIALSNDGESVLMFGGYSSGSMSSTRKNLDGTINNSGWTGYNCTNGGYGVLGNSAFIVGDNNSPYVGFINLPASGNITLGGSSNLIPNYHSSGFVSVQVGAKVYLISRAVADFQVFDMSTPTVAAKTLARFGSQCHTYPVWDGADSIYAMIGADVGKISGLRKYTLSTGVWETIPLTGDYSLIPTPYPGKRIHMQWFEGAIYFWRCDMDSAAGKKLWRIT